MGGAFPCLSDFCFLVVEVLSRLLPGALVFLDDLEPFFVFWVGLDAFGLGGGETSSVSYSGVGGLSLLAVRETREEAVTVCETLEVTEIETWRSD